MIKAGFQNSIPRRILAATRLGAFLLALVAGTLPAARASQSTQGVLQLARRGINVPAFVYVDKADGTQGIDTAFTYREQHHLTDARFVGKLRQAGVELVRLVVNPLPLIYGPVEHRRGAVHQVVRSIRTLHAAGIFGIVDLHFWSPDPTGGIAEIFRDDAVQERYRQALRHLAEQLSSAVPHGGAALELLNEPPACAGKQQLEWTSLQPTLVAEIRSVSPTMPLVVTGCVGGVDALLAMSRISSDDPNLHYSFHFYDPFLFTHQSTYYLKDFEAIPYPPRQGDQGAVISALSRIDNPDAWLTTALKRFGGADRLSKRLYLEREIARYFTRFEGRRTIEDRLAAVAAWAATHDIPSHRILMGEFGVTFRADKGPEPLRASKLRWLRDVRQAADRYGFAYAYWLFPKAGTYDHDARTGFLRTDLASALGFSDGGE